jgi:rhomboid protease GluP
VLVGLNVLMFAATLARTMSNGGGGGASILWGMSSEALFRLGENIPFASHLSAWWRLVMAMFLHGGLIHIGFNMMVLMDIGPIVEEVYGSARFLFLYLMTGICGSLMSAWQGRGPSVGASGAILGLIGVMIAITMKRGGRSMEVLRSRLIRWVVSIFAMGLLMPGIDNWGHLGGFLGGFALGHVFVDREPINPAERKLAAMLGFLAAMLIVASFAAMIMHFRDRIPGLG